MFRLIITGMQNNFNDAIYRKFVSLDYLFGEYMNVKQILAWIGFNYFIGEIIPDET